MKYGLLLIPAFLALAFGCSKPEPPEVTIRVVTQTTGGTRLAIRDTAFWRAGKGDLFEPDFPPVLRGTNPMQVLSIPDSSQVIVEVRPGLNRDQGVPKDRDTITVTSTPQHLYGVELGTEGGFIMFVSLMVEGRPPEGVYLVAPRSFPTPRQETRVPVLGSIGSGTSTER